MKKLTLFIALILPATAAYANPVDPFGGAIFRITPA